MSVVDASTLPEGLISTTTTFAIPPLFASTTRPLILMIERRRDAAARAESSVEVAGDVVWVAGVESGEAVGSGDGDEALVGAVFVSVGLVLTFSTGVSGVGAADAGLYEFEVSVDGEAVGSDAVVGAAATDPVPIFSSRP